LTKELFSKTITPALVPVSVQTALAAPVALIGIPLETLS
jgi:hypothetical protein